MFKKAIAMIIIGLFTIGLFLKSGSAETSSMPVIEKLFNQNVRYSQHAPISINCDADFNSSFSNRTIWGLYIDGNGQDYCIEISNCRIPFVIINCFLSGAVIAGIGFDLVSNGTIVNNTCTGNPRGLDLSSSCHNYFVKNNIIDDNIGLMVHKSNFNVFMNNVISNQQTGVYFYYSSLNTLWNNSFINNGIYLESPYLLDYYQIIPSNNTVNNKSLSYHLNETSLHIDHWNLGQLIIVNCTSFDVSNVNCSSTYIGVEIVRSTDINIENSNFSYNKYGVMIFYSDDVRLNENVIYSNSYCDIDIRDSNNNSLNHNSVSSTCTFGIVLTNSSNNVVSNNSLLNSENGISIHPKSDYNIIKGNDFGNHSNRAIYIFHSNCNQIYNNTFWPMDGYAIYIVLGAGGEHALYNRIHHNNMLDLSDYAFVYDYSGGNFWNDSHDGNYWANYYTRYPFAINDGHVWNYSYKIAGNNNTKDYFPLVNKVIIIQEFPPFPIVHMLLIILPIVIIAQKRER